MYTVQLFTLHADMWIFHIYLHALQLDGMTLLGLACTMLHGTLLSMIGFILILLKVAHIMIFYYIYGLN